MRFYVRAEDLWRRLLSNFDIRWVNLKGHPTEDKVLELLDHSYANDVEAGIFKVSIQGNPLRMVSANRVRIVDSYNLLGVLRHQHNFSTLGQTFFHTVSMTIRRSFGGARRTRYESIDSLTACSRNQQEGKCQNHADLQCFFHRRCLNRWFFHRWRESLLPPARIEATITREVPRLLRMSGDFRPRSAAATVLRKASHSRNMAPSKCPEVFLARSPTLPQCHLGSCRSRSAQSLLGPTAIRAFGASRCRSLHPQPGCLLGRASQAVSHSVR